MSEELRTLSLLGGVTAVGKTDAAIEWAQQNNAEILCCDSVSFYRGFDVGSAKPDPEQRKIITHHGLDICDLETPMDVGLFHQYAHKIIEGIHRQKKQVLVVGGSGFYLEGFLNPIADEVEVTEEIRQQVQELFSEGGKESALNLLKQLNPQGLGSLDQLNPVRVQRALERCLASGKSLIELEDAFQKIPKPYPQFQKRMIWLDREKEDLEERIEWRTKQMMETGFVEEVKTLVSQGLEKNAPLAHAVGYREVLAYLKNELQESDLISAISLSTRRLAAKQRKWFRKKFAEGSRMIIPRGQSLDVGKLEWISDT
ncbi:MAG: tRNA (adenosine(37)-N6)-dimethylallyltransferase MiaA [Opitutales bacterium]